MMCQQDGAEALVTKTTTRERCCWSHGVGVVFVVVFVSSVVLGVSVNSQLLVHK